jgi:hypothetical protein
MARFPAAGIPHLQANHCEHSRPLLAAAAVSSNVLGAGVRSLAEHSAAPVADVENSFRELNEADVELLTWSKTQKVDVAGEEWVGALVALTTSGGCSYLALWMIPK